MRDIANDLIALLNHPNSKTVDELASECRRRTGTLSKDATRVAQVPERQKVYPFTWALESDQYVVTLEGPEDLNPLKGDPVVLLYSKDPTRPVGWYLRGRLVYFRTPWEQLLDRMGFLAQLDRDRREKFAKEREDLDQRFRALPQALQKRIERFRLESAGFRVESEAYELFVCEEAVKFRDWLTRSPERQAHPRESANDFLKLTYEEQASEVDLSPQHSGNTFYASVALGTALLTGDPI